MQCGRQREVKKVRARVPPPVACGDATLPARPEGATDAEAALGAPWATRVTGRSSLGARVADTIEGAGQEINLQRLLSDLGV